MRLLYIADNGFSQREGKYYYTKPNYVNSLQLENYFSEIHYIARNEPYDDRKIEIPCNSKVHLISRNDFKDLAKCMKDWKDNYDAILLRNGINGCIGSIIGRKMGKIVIAYNGADPYDFQISKAPNLKGVILGKIWHNLELMKMKKGNYTHYCCEYLADRFFRDENTLICSNVEVSPNNEDIFTRQEKIREGHDQYIIGCLAGSVEGRRKGIPIAIEALRKLGNSYRLEIYGGGNPSQWIQYAKELGVAENVEFLGYCSDKERIFSWLKEIDIYIQPSISEGLPRAVIEAMSVGCPVVATDVGGIPEVLPKEYRIQPENCEELTSKIRWLCTNKDAMIQAAETNFNTSLRYASAERNRKMNAFYNSIVESFEREKNI